MLKLKYLFENFELARKCVELYDYDEESLDRMLPYFRISSNAIYPFRKGTNEDKICFLRLSPIEEKSYFDVLSEVDLIEWLIEKGFSAMQPVPMKNGRLAEQIHTQWGSYNVSCFEKVPGKSLEECTGSIQIVRGYGHTLGRLHALMKEYPYSENRRNHKALLEEISARLKEYEAPEGVKEEWTAVNRELEGLAMTTDDYGIIHYDFEPDNVFYDEVENTFSVIDFDDAINCWYALDIVRALDALDDVVDESLLKEAEDCFLEGYREATKLTEAQMSSFPIMRRLVRLQEYATILYVTSEVPKQMPDWMQGLTEKLKWKLGCLEEAMTALAVTR